MSFWKKLFSDKKEVEPFAVEPNVKELKEKKDVEGLINALGYRKESIKEDDVLVRCYAAEALGEIGDERVVEQLTKVLGDFSDERVRESVKEALEKIEMYSESIDMFWYFDDMAAMERELTADLVDKPTDKILLIGPILGEEKLIDNIQKKLADRYKVLVNHECSLNWLCEKMVIIREATDFPVIMISNFPVEFEGVPKSSFFSDGVQHTIRVPGGDISPRTALDTKSFHKIYWFGLEPYSFLKEILKFFCGHAPERTTFKCLVSCSDDDKLVASERNLLKKQKALLKKQKLLVDISMKLDAEDEKPFGGILRDEIS